MRSRDLAQRRPQKPSLRDLLRQRSSLQVIVVAVAIAAIVLAFVSRSGETPQGAGNADATARPTVAAAVLVSLPTALPSPAPKQERIHVVASGDTLTGLAQKYYADASKWERIFEANRDVMPSSSALQIGQQLKIPD
ncbi:MAG: LysM peptidoglycan-binding domain-containing protein [Chloroflexota bacterium]